MIVGFPSDGLEGLHEGAGTGRSLCQEVAKPIAYTVEETGGNHEGAELAYSIEPIAVSDDNVLALVTLKSIRGASARACQSES